MNKLLYSINSIHYSIFKKGSKTYFYSSLLFPKHIRKDISHLYSFVRTADNFVDSIPQQKVEFKQFIDQLNKGYKQQTGNLVIDDFVELVKERNINKKWVDAFIKSMEMDTKQNSYKNFNELNEYLYGSAEVIGLLLAKILNLNPKSYPYARQMGRAMQFINFIRDIAEDNDLNRTYIPLSELKKYKLSDLRIETTKKNPLQFEKLIRDQINTYFKWQKKAEEGYKYIEPKYLTAIKTASDLYTWTAYQIYKDPFIVYSKKVKPSMHTIISHAGQNMLKKYL